MKISEIIAQAIDKCPASVSFRGRLSEAELDRLEEECEVKCQSVYMDGTGTYFIRYRPKTFYKEKDIKTELIAEVNGYQIIRSLFKTFDVRRRTFCGHSKVYYDVCDNEDLLESFKTLREAKTFCLRLQEGGKR